MTPAFVRLVAVGGLFAGSTLLLSHHRWFFRPSLRDRLGPYVPGVDKAQAGGLLSLDSFREVIGPLAAAMGSRVARLVGVQEDISRRLRRTHRTDDPTSFRVRQLASASAGLALGTLVATTTSAPPLIALALVGAAPLLGFLTLEQQLASASADWQTRLEAELPVIAEQLAMLVAAGWSVQAAVARIAQRGSGACAADFSRVSTRMRHGVPEAHALREWADLAEVVAVDRLVAVLTLNRQTTELGRLLSQEAAVMRADAHRALTETVERRTQQVWVPVTIATLVPGVVLLGVPFLDALALFSNQ